MDHALGTSTGNAISGSASSLSVGAITPPSNNSLVIATFYSDYPVTDLVTPAGYTYAWWYHSLRGNTYYARQTTAVETSPVFDFVTDLGVFTGSVSSFAVDASLGLLQFEGYDDAGYAYTDGDFEAATTDGSLIIVCVGMYDVTNAITITGVTDNAGNTYYPASDLHRSNYGVSYAAAHQIWYASGITGRSGHTITATLSGTPAGGQGMGIYEFGVLGSASPSSSPSASASASFVEEIRLIRRMRQTPHLNDEQFQVFIHRLQLDLETGRGLTLGQGVDPQIMLQWSNDGGKTWSNEQWVSAGAQGAYRWRAVWHRLGVSRDRVWRVVMSDPVPWRLVDAYAQLEKGSS